MMITINLLPQEMRKRSGPPLKVLALVAAGTVTAGVLVATWAWLVFGEAAEIESRRMQLALEMDGLRPQLKYNQALDAEIKVAAAREATLADINKERILWSEKIDQLVDIVNSGNEVEHFTWLDDLTVRQETPRRGSNAYGSLSAAGHSGSERWDQVANFLEDIEDRGLTDFMREFHSTGRPEASINEPDEELIPAVNWSFPLSLELKGPQARWEARLASEQARAEAAAKAAQSDAAASKPKESR